MEKIILNTPLDMHLHLREGKMLENIIKYSSENFSAGIVMPNLQAPITNEKLLDNYISEIKKNTKGHNFTPLMTLFFKVDYTREFLEKVKSKISAIKLYPAGITTNSEGGVQKINVENLKPVLEIMQDLGIILCIHGETDGFVMDREKEFVPIYESLAKSFPDLKIIMEHITTKESVDLLDKYPNLYATITVHHLIITLDDLAGGNLKPHLFCKPIAKKPKDREALLKVALNAHSKVMFGSDSAPHPIHKKESCGCAAGIFSSPVALQILTELFEKNDKLENLQSFISNNAVKIYNLKLPKKEITLNRKDFVVPEKYGEVVPFYAGQTLKWSISE